MLEDVELYLFQLRVEEDSELSEEEIEEHVAKILAIGKAFREESSALAIVGLMEGIKPFLKRLTREKAKKLMGQLVDLHLDILVSFTQDDRWSTKPPIWLIACMPCFSEKYETYDDLVETMSAMHAMVDRL